MKKILLASCLIALSSINIQASSLPETIMQSPVTHAVIGYIAGNLGYQVLSGCNVNPLVNFFTQEENGEEFDLVGVQCMGACAYIYEKHAQQELSDSDNGLYDIARFANKKVCTFKTPVLSINTSETEHHNNRSEEEIGAALVLDLRPIAIGLITGGLTYYAAIK